MNLRPVLLLTLVLLQGACGLHLRGHEAMPFRTLYLQVANPNSDLARDLRRSLADNNVVLADDAAQADVVLNIVSEDSNKLILTLGSSGRVTEFQLNYKVSLRAYDNEQHDWLRADEIAMQRDFSYDDTKILAKEAEEQLLYQSMRDDMVREIMRRLSHAKPLPG